MRFKFTVKAICSEKDGEIHVDFPGSNPVIVEIEGRDKEEARSKIIEAVKALDPSRY